MDANVKQLWISALRSGEYDQGRGVLHYERDGVHSYCCLGVLCDVAVRQGIISAPREVDKEYIYAGATTELPIPVMEWAGLDNPSGSLGRWVSLTGNVRSANLVNMNDALQMPFWKIADVIEEYF